MTVKDIPIASNELASLRSRAIILKWNLSYLDCFMLCKQSRFLSLELLISLWRWTHNMSKGMINNPNLQPNPTINWWIVGILLFTFHVVYILADCYAGSNGLSCHPPSENDPPEEDDFEDWLDNAYSFSITLLNNWSPLSTGPANTSRHPCLASHLLPPLSIFISASLGPVQDSLEIPWSQKALTKEAWINQIHNFLDTHIHPDNLFNNDFTSFINSITRFFLLNRSLYCREPHGQHQLIVPVEHCYGVIKEAHDSLRHEGGFSVQTRLLLWFWWPMLVDNIKWYIQMCHECQIHQTQKLHISPTIPVMSRLFHKVHIDMMVMPQFRGSCFIIQAWCTLTV